MMRSDEESILVLCFNLIPLVPLDSWHERLPAACEIFTTGCYCSHSVWG